jgi:hypothetical protein
VASAQILTSLATRVQFPGMRRAAYFLVLFVVFIGMLPSPVAFVVIGGMEPVWVYYADWRIDGDRFWIIAVVSWAVIDVFFAWWVAGFVLRLDSSRRRVVLPGVPLFLMLVSLLPIYSPTGHGQSASSNVVGEFKQIQQRMHQKKV